MRWQPNSLQSSTSEKGDRTASCSRRCARSARLGPSSRPSLVACPFPPCLFLCSLCGPRQPALLGLYRPFASARPLSALFAVFLPSLLSLLFSPCLLSPSLPLSPALPLSPPPPRPTSPPPPFDCNAGYGNWMVECRGCPPPALGREGRREGGRERERENGWRSSGWLIPNHSCKIGVPVSRRAWEISGETCGARPCETAPSADLGRLRQGHGNFWRSVWCKAV